jgi:SAM-dependent methyltransferase
MSSEDWFATWFETDYYHTLYKYRDKAEAEHFIQHLLEALEAPPGSNVLDLACGKGRHSITLNELGMNVLGADLSANSISQANESAKVGLEFLVHDMREVIEGRKFDYVFNLFTSFGYFDEKVENQKVIDAIAAMLNPNGQLVIDFLNAHKVIRELIPNEVKSIDGIDFHITREYNGSHILKHIRFEDDGKLFHFTERVQALKLEDFEQFLKKARFEIIRTFGDFDLRPYEEQTSSRLIIIAKRTS